MANEEKGRAELRINSGVSTDNASIRKVQPINDTDTEREAPAPIGGSGRNITGEIMGFVSSAGSAIGSAAAHGAKNLVSSGFGVKPIIAVVSNGVNRVADYLHLSRRGVSLALILALLLGGGGGAISLMNSMERELILKQEDYYDPCADIQPRAKKKELNATVEATGDMEENAKKIWAFGKAFGFTDEQCAGMLGNIQGESGGMDPTAVEAISGEPYEIGPRKSQLVPPGVDFPNSAMDSHIDYIETHTPGGIARNAYRIPGGHYCCGIGLIQFTGPAGANLIDFANQKGRNWYDLDVQLAFLISDSDFAARFERVKSAAGNSVDDAADAYFGYVERGLSSPQPNSDRERMARDWYSELSGADLSAYDSFAQSVMSLAGTASQAATVKKVSRLDVECVGRGDEDDDSLNNSSLADAMVAYSYETYEQGRGNDGTPLYRAVHDAVMPGDPFYQSCDRGVATAVRWSGADDNFPAGPTATQYAYLLSHPDLWQDMGHLTQETASNLKPGDILITEGNGHIVMYVGNEAVRKKFSNSNATIASASYGSRSPGLGSEGPMYYADGGGDSRSYHVFRYIGNYSGSLKNAYSGTDT